MKKILKKTGKVHLYSRMSPILRSGLLRVGRDWSDKETPAILLENISDGLIAESKADSGCKTFVEVSRADSKKVILRNNNTAKAARRR